MSKKPKDVPVRSKFDDDFAPASDPTRRQKELDYARDNVRTPNAKQKSYIDVQRQEQMMVEAIDDLRALKRLGPIALKLQSKKMTLEQAIRESTNDSFLLLMKLAYSEATSDKVKADVLKHMLALAGHNPSQKHQIERIDPDTSREALLAMINGAEDVIEKEFTAARKAKIKAAVEADEAKWKSKMATGDEADEYDYKKYEAEPSEPGEEDARGTAADSSRGDEPEAGETGEET